MTPQMIKYKADQKQLDYVNGEIERMTSTLRMMEQRRDSIKYNMVNPDEQGVSVPDLDGDMLKWSIQDGTIRFSITGSDGIRKVVLVEKGDCKKLSNTIELLLNQG